MNGWDFTEPQNRIAGPVFRQDGGVVEFDLLFERPTQGLDQTTFELIFHTIGVHQLPCIGRHIGLEHADIPRLWIDLHLKRHGAVARNIFVSRKRHPSPHVGGLHDRLGPQKRGDFLQHIARPGVFQVTQAVLDGVNLKLGGNLIHERLDGEYIRISPQAACGRDANRHLRDEIRRHLVAFEFIKGNGIAIGRVIGWPSIFWNHQIEGFFQIPGRQQIAWVPIGSHLVGVGPQLQVPIQNLPARAETGLGFDHHCRAIRLPLVLLGAGVLQANR